MMRHTDKIVSLVGIIALALMVLYQSVAMVRVKMALSAEIEKADKLSEQADANNLAPLPRNTMAYAGKVFIAWERLPIVGINFHPADFFPGPETGR